MNASELRIGNWIISDGVVVQTDTRSIFDMAYYSKSYMPIPLTENWLIKLGFEKIIDIVGQSKIEYIDYRMEQFVCFLLPENGLEVEFWAKHNNINERGYLTVVKYVHQLQNLYFALIGKELTHFKPLQSL